MPVSSKLCVFGATLACVCDQTLAVNSVQRGGFARRGADPHWNGTSVQGPKTYKGDYVKDDSHVRAHANAGSWAHAAHSAGAGSSDGISLSSPMGGHSKQWYKDECTKIKLDCEDRKEAVEKAQAAKIDHLEDRYKRRTKVVGEMEEQAEDAEDDYSRQKTAVKDSRAKVKEAKVTYEKTKDCPEELEKLEEELEELLAEPNDSEKDIDEECRKRKEILAKEQCVDKFIEAQSILTRRQMAHSGEKDDLSQDRSAAKQAEQAVNPHEVRADAAKEDLDKARKDGARSKLQKIDGECKREMDRLNTLADQEVEAAEAAYRKHQRMQDAKEQLHDDLKEDAKDQKQRVKDEKKRVEDARKVHDKLKNCEAELKKAEQDLERLEATPNESEEDIDKECELKKLIMKKRRCVEEAREARDVLTRSEARYSAERRELQNDRQEAKRAGVSADNYQNSVNEFEEALKAAKAARRALHECAADEEGGSAADEEGGSAAGEEGGSESKKKENGAGAAHPAMMALLIGLLPTFFLLRA